MKVMHISDLHFNKNAANFEHEAEAGHSLQCLLGIQKLVEKHRPTHLVISGDITHLGDKDSLEMAYQWIHSEIYADGESYGLSTKRRGIVPIIVPGNHDAYNAGSPRSWYRRWQSALSNFYDGFPDYKWREAKSGVQYHWFDNGEVPVLFYCVNSCHLGERPNIFRRFSPAKGKISMEQSRAILELFDNGMSGKLDCANDQRIDGCRFRQALKLLVMHHFLFRPTDTSFEPCMGVTQRRTVFQNFAMADVDMILCGHKHAADNFPSVYARHFDPRAEVRLAFNYARRTLGLNSLPLAVDESGIPVSKTIRVLFGFIAKKLGKEKLPPERKASDVIQYLEHAMAHPHKFKEDILAYVKSSRGDINIDKNEITELYKAAKKQLGQNNQEFLKRIAGEFRDLMPRLHKRQFNQIMPGSSAKSSERGPRARGVNLYDISVMSENGGYEVDLTQCNWNDKHGEFDEGHKVPLVFPVTRGIHVCKTPM